VVLMTLALQRCSMPAMDRYTPLGLQGGLAAIDSIHVVRFAVVETIRVEDYGRRVGCGIPVILVGGLGPLAAGLLMMSANAEDPRGPLLALVGSTVGLSLGAAIAMNIGWQTIDRKAANLPDPGEIALNRFLERAPNELPDWPRMIVDSQPAKELYAPRAKYVLEFRPMQMYSPAGFGYTWMMAGTLLDDAGQILWQRTFYYNTKKAGRGIRIPPGGLPDRWSNLREEMTFSGDTTAGDFIQHLRGHP
jgi:hypothetical protein